MKRYVGHELERLESGENGVSGLPVVLIFWLCQSATESECYAEIDYER